MLTLTGLRFTIAAANGNARLLKMNGQRNLIRAIL